MFVSAVFHKLGEFHQMVNFGALGDRHELIRFWDQPEQMWSEKVKTYKSMATRHILYSSG